MQLLTNLKNKSSIQTLHLFPDFPTTPEEGQLVLKTDGLLYIYTTIEGQLGWRPLNVKAKSYVHDQSSANVTWNITHNLHSTDVVYFIYDTDNNLVFSADQTFPTQDTMTILFTEAIAGKAIIFAVGDSYMSSGGGSGSGDVDLSAVNQNIIPDSASLRDIGSATKPFSTVWCDHLQTSGNSIYVNGKKVVEDESNTIVVSTSVDQDLAIKTTGEGDIRILSDNVINTSSKGDISTIIGNTNANKNMNFTNQSTGGTLNFTSINTGDITFLNSADNGKITLTSNGVGGEVELNGTLIDINSSVDISGSLTVNGNFNVLGTTTSVNSTNLNITDNEIVINNGEAGAGVTAGSAGIRINRGTENAALLYFSEADDKFYCGIQGGTMTQIGAGGGSSATISVQSGDYQVSGAEIVLCNNTSGQTITLGTLSSGTRVDIKKIVGGGAVNVVPLSGTIDGAGNQQLTVQYESLTFVTDGVNWFII